MLRAGAWLLVGVLAAGLTSAAAVAECTSSSTQQDMNACAGNAMMQADAALNAAYRKIMMRLKQAPAEAKLLVEAQRAWVTFRDAECTFAASGVAGGSIYPMIVTNCRDGLTQKRTDELKAYLNCQEGDMSCPVPGR